MEPIYVIEEVLTPPIKEKVQEKSVINLILIKKLSPDNHSTTPSQKRKTQMRIRAGGFS